MSNSVSNTFLRSAVHACPYSCTFLFFGRYVQLYADVRATIERFTAIYPGFAATCLCDADITCCIVSSSDLRQRPFLLAGSVFYDLPESDTNFEYAELIIFQHLFECLDDYLVLHAGVVSSQDRAIILYGQSGFGKTTLTLELLSRGYGFMSDEFCPLRISDCMVEPFERLVGLKKTNPFYARINPKRSFFHKAEGKLFFDCADMFPYSPAQPCPPGVFIEIVGDIDVEACPAGCVAVDIYLCRDSSSVPDALRRLSGVTVSEPSMRGSYAVCRVTASDRTEFVSRFNQIWLEYSNDILSVFPYRGEIGTYVRQPELRSLPAFDALTSLGANIVNRAPNGRLLAALDGKTSSLVMLLGNLLKSSSFYSLKPGQLEKTADLIDNLKY